MESQATELSAMDGGFELLAMDGSFELSAMDGGFELLAMDVGRKGRSDARDASESHST